MNRTAFRDLLIRYSNGTATAEEKALVNHWYELLYNNQLPALKQDELDNIEQEMWAHIEKSGHLSKDQLNMPVIRGSVSRFNRQQASFTRSIAFQPQVIYANSKNDNGQLVFTDAPASDVLMALQKAYGIPIVFDEELMSHCSFSGAFTNETFFERISLVCKAIEARYEQADGQVIISGSGCAK